MEAVMFLTEAEMVPETEVTDPMFLMEVLTMEATMTEAMMMEVPVMVTMMAVMMIPEIQRTTVMIL